MAKLPLEGVRILDMTVVWAGPYSTMLLGDMNPRFIMVSASGMGATGPYQHFHGWGNHFEDMAGHTWLRGYPDSDPSTTTGSVLSDTAAGAGIAAAVLMALHYRNRSGKG